MTTETQPYPTTATVPVRVRDAEGADTGQVTHVTVLAHPTATPGLVITPDLAPAGFTGDWAITHAASGHQIPVVRWDGADFGDMLQVAKALGATPVDWTAGKDTLLAQINEHSEAVRAAIREGRFPTPEPDDPDAAKGDGPAPYPATAAQATADALARHLTAEAEQRCAETQDLLKRATRDDPDGAAIYGHHAHALIAEWGLVSVLRDFAAVDQKAADHAARQVWHAWEDGGTVHELTWEWARGYGLPEPAKGEDETPATHPTPGAVGRVTEES